MEVTSINIKIWMDNEDDCRDLLGKNWDKVPLLNSNDIQNLQDGKLVRFKGMVQDMYDPEYYFEKYEVVNEVTMDTSLKNGKYRDTTDCTDKEVINFESSKNVTAERHTYFVISLPGFNKWAEDVESNKNKIKTEKQTSTSPVKTKRTLDEETEDSAMEIAPSTSTANTKKMCTTLAKTTSQQSSVSSEHLLNFPLPERSGKACHLKLYTDKDDLKLNDAIECVGFLSISPLLYQSGGDAEEERGESVMELQTHNPPPSLIPRIHCVELRKIEKSNPLIEDGKEMPLETMHFLRKELHIALSQLLLGDELAAEYLIYHLISKVYLRTELMSLGKFSLNISNIPATDIPNYGEEFYKFIELFLPKSHYLPMTLENMNEFSFIPKKDYQCNRITSGILQLSNNTHLVLDETKLSVGKVNEAGIRAVGAISNVIKNQKTSIDFNYYKMEFDCDIPILVLSEGKSMLPSDCHIPLKIDQVCFDTFDAIVIALKAFLKPDVLDGIRMYLSLRRHAQYELADNVNELVQNEFVKMRQAGHASVDDLHSLLVLARLVCLAEGKNTLDEACWKRACQLETERKERLRKD